MTGLGTVASSGNLCLAAGRRQWWPYQGTCFSDPAVLVSEDGAHWNANRDRSLPSISNLATDGSNFLAIADSLILATTNGFDWVTNAAYSPETPYISSLRDVIWGRGLFITVGGTGTILASTNGTCWTNCSVTPTGRVDWLNCAVSSDTGYLAAGTFIAHSENGWVWTVSPVSPVGAPNEIIRVAFGNGKFVATEHVATASGGNLLVSTNGLDWEIKLSSIGGQPVGGVIFGNGLFVAWINGRIWWSRDGSEWNQATASVPLAGSYPGNELPPAIGFHQGRFIAVGAYARIFRSDANMLDLLPGSAGMTPLGFRFEFLASNGTPCRIQFSSGLTDWQDLSTFLANGGTNVFLDSAPSLHPQRFFRIVSP
jgi:hypothetical protein